MKPSSSRMRERKFIDLLRKTKWSKWSHRFSVTLQGLLKIKCRHPALDFTRNRISWSFWPTEKAGRAAGRDSQIFDRQLAKINGPKWPVEGSQGGTPCPVIWCCASYPTGYYLAQNGGKFSSFAAAFSPPRCWNGGIFIWSLRNDIEFFRSWRVTMLRKSGTMLPNFTEN